MCATCGCADGARIRHQHEDGTWHYHDDGTRHDHDDGAWHEHGAAGPGQPHEHAGGQTVTLEEKVLARNDALAAQNRDWLRARGILALNLMGSPGAGKTTLLERTALDLAGGPSLVSAGDRLGRGGGRRSPAPVPASRRERLRGPRHRRAARDRYPLLAPSGR